MQFIAAGVLYFALTYLAGFAFGSVRERVLVPRIGQLVSTLIEVPIMLAATYLAAHFVVGWHSPLEMHDRLIIGGVGFALLMTAEGIFSGLLRGWTVAQWLSHFKKADGAISLAMFVVFAFMPLAVRRG